MSYSKKFQLSHEEYSHYSSSDEEVTPKSYKKIQTIWKDLRHTKNLTEALKSMKVQEVKPLPANHIENHDIIEKLARTEKLLNESQDEVVLLKKKLKDAENEIERCHTKIAKQLNVNALQSNQLDEIMTKYEDLSIVYKEHLERSKETNIMLDREVEEKNKEIEKLKTMSKERLDKYSSAHMSFEQASNKVGRLEYELSEKNEELAELRQRIQDDEKLFSEIKKLKQSENSALAEVDHLRAEVQRLVKLLKTTKEYKNFADFTNGGTMRYLKDANKRHRTPSTDYSRTSISGRNSVQKPVTAGRDLGEKELWVSQDAYNVTLEFIEKNQGVLDETNMDKLLLELNRIWSKREQEKVDKLTSQYRSEISTLKRKLSYSMTSESIDTNQKTIRAKSRSKDVEKENERPSMRPSPKIPPSGRILDGQTKSNISFEKYNERNEENILRSNNKSSSRTKPFEESFEVDNNDIMRKFERIKMRIEELLGEFIRKRKEIIAAYNGRPEVETLIRKEDWLLESIETLLEEFSRGMISIKGKKPQKSTSSAALNYTIL